MKMHRMRDVPSNEGLDISWQDPAAAWQKIAEADVIHFHLLEPRL